MKKILIIAAMFATSAAFAGEGERGQSSPVANASAAAQSTGVQKQQQQQQANSNSTSGSASIAGSTSQGGAGGSAAVSGVASSGNTSGNVTITQNCLVNCAPAPDTTTRDEAAVAASLAIAAGNQQAARDVAGTTQKIANTPSVNGPQLVTSNDTCMGSTSGSANVPGIGIGFGTSWVDQNCKMLKNSRELWNMGMKGAAMALMCKDADNREALELTGFECPQTTKAKAESKKVADAQPAEITDPIVRARLGMPELTASTK